MNKSSTMFMFKILEMFIPPKCSKCDNVLSPCLFCEPHEEHGERVQVYNGGEYYRIFDLFPFPIRVLLCGHCFNRDQDERRREKERREEEQQRREKEKRREEEQQRREKEKRREEEQQRREKEKRREEEQQRREKEKRREEEQQRREKEKRREEEQQRREEERRKEEEQQRREKERRREELNQRLKESLQRAKAQHEKLSNTIAAEHESKRDVLITRLGEFKDHYESDSDELLKILSLKCSIPFSNLSVTQLTADELGKIPSVLGKLLFDEWIRAPPSLSTLQHTQVFIIELCVLSLETSDGVSLQNISNQVQSLVESISQSACNVSKTFFLTQALYLNLMHFLTEHDSSDTDGVLIAKQWAEDELPAEKLLLIEFLSILTSSLQETVEEASVFILKMEIQCLKLLLSTLSHLNVTETHSESTGMLLRLVQTNQWTPTEVLTLLKALSQKYAEDASITEVLRSVHLYNISPKWTDESGHSLIQALDFADAEKFHQDFQKSLRRSDENSLATELKQLQNLDDHEIDMIKNIITGVLQYTRGRWPAVRQMLRWCESALLKRDSFERGTLNAAGLQNSLSQLCKAVYDTKGWWPTVRQMLRWCESALFKRDCFERGTLNAADLQNSLSQLCKAVYDTKGWWPTVRQMLRWCESALFKRDCFERGTLNAADLQNSLSQLCKAVYDTKGWWPTVRQMLQWCVLMLTEKSGALELVDVKEDPCVTAMFAATRVRMGNKVDVVLSSEVHTEEQTTEWSDFYKNLGISINTNVKKNEASLSNVYEADIVYGTINNFISDYFLYSREVMETGNPLLGRGFIITEQSLSSSHHLELLRLKDNDSLVFSAEVLQSLMGKFHGEDMELRCRFMKALFQLLHTNLNDPNADNKVITILKKITGQGLSPGEVFTLTFLENLLKVVFEETGSETHRTSPAGSWCLDILFACVEKMQTSTTAKEVFRMVSDIVAQGLWSPEEALNLIGAVTDHHQDDECISIMKILHLTATYQVSTKWTDENHKSLLTLLDSSETENLIKHLEKSLKDEKMKSTDTLFEETWQMGDIDEQTLSKSHSVVTHVTNLIRTGEIKKHKNIQRARTLSHSTNTEDLQEVLAVLCNAVHLHKAEGKWWPRATQMISWCLLALSDTGKLLEMGTGEGKSCVIAMFAVLRVLRGEKVDVVSSSSVLCQRDAEEWNNFYKYFGVTADTNTNKTEDEDRKECYQKDVVYGTIEAFAADHLRQIFEMKDVRPDRRYQCIIIDEVDSLLLDQGVQLTYLSSPMVSMQHLNVILTMIWGHVRQYGFLSAEHRTFVQGPPASFFKAIFDSIDTEETEIKNPKDILRISEEFNTVPKGFTEEFYQSDKDELLWKLKTVGQDAMVTFFKEIEQYVPYGFTVYTLDDRGLLYLRRRSPYENQDIPELKFLVLGEGLCCPLFDSEETLIEPIAELISEKIQYTPCTNDKDKISIPGFLKNLVEKKVSVWVQNAFLALKLKEGQEYVVENDNVCPVDFRSTGIVELNKKWGDGLQQFVEIKHQIKLSTISVVTNYISNISLFEKYDGKIFGTTGTLGSKTDMQFLQDLHPTLSACKIPTFNRKKLFEVKGTLKASAEEWKSEIKRVVMAQISPNSFNDGRAALVICESINKAKAIHEELKSITRGKVLLYCRSDSDSLSKIDEELLPGDVIVATNLAGRGTDIKVSKQVNDNGGLFVILSFLSENTRVELQAFGRTARKGKPGSAQIIVSTEHLPQSFRNVSSLKEAKSTRDRLAAEKINHMKQDVTELKLREDLFSEYCKTLEDIHKNTDGDNKRVVVAIMNEFWGIWLQTKSEEIDQLKRNELQTSLKDDLARAKSQSQSQTSPCSSIYHYNKFGYIALTEKKWDVSTKLFEKALKLDESWAAIAFYSHAYCTLKQRSPGYLTKARDDLRKAQESLKYLSEEPMVCLQLVKMSPAESANSDPTSLEKQLTNRYMMLSYFDKNISDVIQKLDMIQEKETRENKQIHAQANKSSIFSLVPSADEDLKLEVYNLYNQGLEYVFSVEEEPGFQWGALLVFSLGALQIIAGALLIGFTAGTLAQVGFGLISEGISDCISGIESMVTGDFSWQSWATGKAISIGVSLVAFGVGKVIAKGFKGTKMAVKGFRKELKMLPEFLSRQAKDCSSVVTKTTMKTLLSHTAKKVAEEVIMYGVGKVEQKILTDILDRIKNMMKGRIVEDVKSNMEKEPLATLVDVIVLSHAEDEMQLHDLLKDVNAKSELLDIFRALSKTALQPFYADLTWQNNLNSSISTVMDRVKAQAKGRTCEILNAIQVVHMVVLAEDAISAALSLSSRFFSNLHKQLDGFKKDKGFSEKVDLTELPDSDKKMLDQFKQDLADTISVLLADALVEVFHQKFSSHIVSHAQSQINGVIRGQLRAGLKSDRIKEKLRAAQNNRYIAYMPADPEHTGEAGELSQSHAEKIKDPETTGTILDIKVLSETTGTKVVILTEDSHGRLTKMQEVSPGTGTMTQTVTLIYRPQSDQYPDGHYDVRINNKTVSINSEGKSCLFHALAQGMKPEASESEITLEARHLRSAVADALQSQPSQWEPFIKRKVWTEAIRGGDWYMAQGTAQKKKKTVKENENLLKHEVGKVATYKEWKKHARKNPGLGEFINADHQPPVSSILGAINENQNSKLAEAMLEVGTKSSPLEPNLIPKVRDNHGRELPTVSVPKETHKEFVSTKSKAFRTELAKTIAKDDVVGTLKLTCLGAMPGFMLDRTKDLPASKNNPISQTRLSIFKNSYQKHSKAMAQTWFKRLEPKGVMTKEHLTSFNEWIDNGDYNDQNDRYRSTVINILQQREKPDRRDLPPP